MNFNSDLDEIHRAPSNVVDDDHFKTTITVILQAVINNDKRHGTPADKNISQSACTLIEDMRKENPTHFNNFIQKLKNAFKNRSGDQLSNLEWFQLTFEDLISKVVDHPSWRALLNMLNCCFIVLEASKDHLNQAEKSELKNKMLNVSEKFINRRFRRFVETNDNWKGLVSYHNQVVQYGQQQHDGSFLIMSLSAVATVIGAFAMFRR